MNVLKTNQEPDYSRAIALTGWAVLFLALLAFAGWITGFHILSSFSSKYIPMAPSTAISTMIFGFVLLSGAYKQNRGYSKWLIVAVICFVALYGFFMFLGYLGTTDNSLEDFLFPPIDTVGRFPINHMSPYSGLLFLLCGVALEINILFPEAKNLANIISSLGLTVVFAGFVAVLGYLFGTPFLYGGHIIPLSIPTSITFLLFGIGLIGIAGSKGIFLRQFVGNTTNARVLRAILPVVLSAIILKDMLDIILSDDLQIKPALLLALLTIIFSVLTTFVVVRLTKKIFRSVDKVEMEKLKSESALKKSEEFNLRMVSLSPIGILLLDKSGRITFENPVMRHIMGRPDGLEVPVEGMNIIELLREKGSLDDRTIAEVLQGATITGKDIHYQSLMGLELDIEIFSTPIIDENGNMSGTMVMLLDITRRKQAEREIELQKIKFQQLFENSPIGMVMIDEHGKIQAINKNFEAIFHFSIGEIQGHAINEFIVPEEFIAESHYLSEKTVEGEVAEKETFRRRKDGSLVPVHVFGVPISIDDNQLGLYGMYIDITERKQRELEMQVLSDIGHSVSTTSNLTELMKLIHDSLRKVLYAENCFFALHDDKTGFFSFPYYVDQKDTVPPPTAMLKSCTSYVFRSGKSLIVTSQVFQQLKSQNEIELVGSFSPSWIGVPLQTASRVIGVLVLQHYSEENVYTDDNLRFLDSIASQIANVIERRKANDALKESEALLHELNASKDKFFSIISHDLKSPFNSILGFSDILAEQVREKNLEGIEEYAEIIQNSSQRAMDLLSNLLEWSRSQTGRMEFNPQNTKIATLINEAIELLNDSAQQKSISISSELSPNITAFVDKAMINSILRNLISNSIKFTEPGGAIIVSAERKRNELLVTVSDNGIGMNEGAIRTLFRIGESYSTKGTQNEMGTGLGLILCKEFIEKHGGKIWAESVVGKGSKFCFVIPNV